MIQINDLKCKGTLKTAAVLGGYLLIAAVAAFGQQQINLIAAPTTTALPDGTTVPMWGYTCGALPTGVASTATCAALNPLAGATWSPVVITVPTGAAGGLQINLTNNLSFTPGTPAGSAPNNIPTSIVIVGQVGGGLGGTPTTTPPPNHSNTQGCPSWFIASNPPGTPCTALTSGASNAPPVQGPRIQSMGMEVGAGATVALKWAALKPGTYLLESGTHPSIQVPMGLIGMLVVTTAPSGTTAGAAYPAVGTSPAVPYNAEVPVEFSEIDPVQNNAVNTAVNTAGFLETTVWSGLPGGCANPATPNSGNCYPPAVNYTPFYFLINGVAFNKTNPAASVFTATAGVDSSGNPVTTNIAGTVLVRIVNAGLRMHTPSIVNSTTQGFSGAGAAATVAGFTLIAEDGNVLPNVAPPNWTGTVPAAPRVQTDVLMVPSKVYDALVNVPAAATTGATAALPIFARDLGLSANSSVRDAGMIAYLSVNNSSASAGLPVGAGSGVFAAGQANPDTYAAVIPCTAAPCSPLVVSDASKGVIANDVNVYGVHLLTAPTGGTLTCAAQSQNSVPGICANGTFIYTPNAGTTSDSFTYCANNAFVPAAGATPASCTSPALTAMVTLGASSLTGNPTAIAQAYTAKAASFIKIPSPGLLAGNSDPNGLPLSIVLPSTPTAGVVQDAQGGFSVLNPTPSTTAATNVAFNYTVQNSQGRTASGTVTVTFPAPSNLQVNVLDAQAYRNCNLNTTCISQLPPFPDYRWIIEEDKTFWVDPNCTTNSSINTPGCPGVVGPSGQSTVPAFGVNFHTSTMDFVAQGCTGPLSCEGGQFMLDNRPLCVSPGVPAGCSMTAGQHIPAVCDLGNGACRPDPTGNGFTAVLPSSVHLDPAKRYYISVLPGDAGNPFPAYTGQPVCPTNGGEAPPPTPGVQSNCGHTMGGAPIPPACNILGGPNACTNTSAFAPVNVLVLPTPLPTGKLSVIVFEDDWPLNGEQDAGAGNGNVAPIEPGLGGFNLVLWDTFGGLGDVTGQDTYDMFNQPLSNSLAGTIDPATGLDACPVSPEITANVLGTGNTTTSGQGAQQGITGMIVTCPKFESDGQTLSPLAGQAVIANLMPEKFSVQAYPAADRIARGEEWLQTNTLDGQHPHDSFIRIGEPSYFQEYGPAGYHVSIGFASPSIINARHNDVCNGLGSAGAVGPCTNTIKGQVDVERLSRTPDQRLYASGSRDALAWTQCWVSLGDPDGEDFEFTKCDANGNFQFTQVPGGNWRLTIGDQWNDQIIDGLSTPANVTGGSTLDMGNIGVQQWQSNLYTRTFIDDNKNGIWDQGEIGIPFLYTRVYYRDGHNSNGLNTDFNGIANFNEEYPLFNWYVVEADSTRYKTTGIHTVYDAGGPADGSPSCGTSTNGARPCGGSSAYNFLTNTYEAVPLPGDLSVPGAVYCKTADCTTEASDFAAGKPTAAEMVQQNSTGRIDPPWVWGEGWAGLTGLSNWIDFGKAPYAACPPACATVTTTAPGSTTPTTTQVGENGGIQGQVSYASTRPFDSASQMILQPWEPLVPNVTINLYQEGFAADGVTPTLTMVDTTQTTSWDTWAQGFYPNSTATPGTGQTSAQKPYMNCPGQGTNTGTNADLFYFTLFDQPNYLDWYNSEHNGGTLHTLPYNSQFKCYDSMHIANQLQPAPYDGQYSFPSSLGINATTGKPLPTVGMTNGKPSSMPGTNCTVCVPNPDTTDVYRVGTPMLPPGKYVVEVIMPPGYEVYKEEDKNLLIGDNYIAPVTQEFGGLGADIFIIPDQASVASMYDESGAGYNGTNYQNSTTNTGLADELSGVPGYPGFQDPLWPCVGEMRVVPDYLSLYPQVHETAPYAGTTRPLCDRKEATLANQMSVRMHFAVFTSTHIAAKFAGGITDDFTSEFDPFSPQFGEKFAPPNLPISTRDYLGNEISRVYSDHWGTYDGLNFSSWEVNPPNITGYSPTMMVQCMNDPGPVRDTNPSSPTYGQLISDPLYNPAYSDFCYENPYMPGLTTYLDTPVVPTEAFVGAGYNNPDCAYPDATPAIKEVDGDQIGPWVSAAGTGHTLTITALGDVQVQNSAYSGPSANVAPFNQKTISRHYGFGTTQGTVTIGGINALVTSWSDAAITVTVPPGVPNCTIQQQPQYANNGMPGTNYGTASCGQLVITASNGKQSIDTVNVTIGGKAPWHVSANSTIQSAIDGAAPGDLIIVDPTCTTVGTTTNATCSNTALHVGTPTQTASVGSHNEMLIMWKPVRLQGVGAVSSIVNASAFPAGTLLDPWRRHVNCLFGLTLSGVPMVGTGATPPYDPTGTYSCPDANIPGDTWNYFTTPSSKMVPQIDRLPLEATVGWDATLNGNLAEQLQEPALMGAYEGAGITVLAKGVQYAPGAQTEAAFPANTLMLQNVPAYVDTTGATVGPQYTYCTQPGTATELVPNPYPSNFMCNPSSIDGLTVENSSQGGGGVFVHGWAHNLQIANNRVYNNAGSLSGGISVGQGEFAPANVVTATGIDSTGTGVGACLVSNAVGTHLPYCLDLNVNVHNNFISNNSSLGDELFSGTLSGGGGVTFCTGADYYKFQYNWVCGNLSAAEGGGIVHLGFSYNGDIEHNTIALNQSTNPTIPTNGGGIMIEGTPDTDPTCGGIPDSDCPPGLSDGTGPGLVINANLIQANSADSGSGGGIRLQQVNGTDVSSLPTQPTLWNGATITNNIIVNNVAGWDGAGISLQDSLNVSIINNTIASNDALASSGVLTYSIGTPDASAPAGNCVQPGPTGPTSASCPQSAGVTSTPDSSILTTTFATAITCPFGEPSTSANSSSCLKISNPLLQNNVIWQNRSFYIGVGNLGQGNLNQQKLVSLFNAFSGTAAPVQTASGTCSSGTSYWDIGVRGDSAPNNHSGGLLNPSYSILGDPTDYPGANNTGVSPGFVNQYCNGSRVPPECSVADGCGGPSGYGVPPGIVDALAPNPVFSLTPSATVDEGNNWINVSWGPLALSNDAVTGGASGHYGGGNPFGNYALLASLDSTAAAIPTTEPHYNLVPKTDFFGNLRPEQGDTAKFDPGAVEFGSAAPVAVLSVTGGPLTFNAAVGYPSAAKTLTLHNTGTAAAFGITPVFSSPVFSRPAGAAGGTCGATLNNAATCTINVVFTPTATGTVTGTLTIFANVNVTGSPVSLSGTGVPPVITATLTPATWIKAQAANCPGTGIGVINCTLDPTQTFTLTNTGNVPLTGITQGTLSSATPGDFLVVTLLSTCGPAAGGQLISTTTLAPGANCTTLVQFKPLTTEPLGTKLATLSITDLAGTQTAALTGTDALPTLTAISPTSGARGAVVPVTLTGNYLDGATAVNVSGSGITCPIAPAGQTSLTTLTANCTISLTAATGTRTVSVTTPTGTSNTVNFTVPGATVTFSAPNPALTAGGTNTKSGLITVSNAAASAGAFTFTAAPTAAKTSGGTGTGTFSVIAGGTCTSTTVVNPGGSCTINVQYSGETTTSTANGTVTITGSGLAAATLTSSPFPAN